MKIELRYDFKKDFLTPICLIVWIVFMVLFYGTGTISNWPVFWIWFPLWASPAIYLSVITIWLLYSIVFRIISLFFNQL